AYVANVNSNNVSGYTINGMTGALTPISGSPFGAGIEPFSVAVDPTGKFAYVANVKDNNVSGYTINGVTGALTPMIGSPFAAGIEPASITTTTGRIQVTAPTIIKAFSPSVIPMNGGSTLDFTIINPNAITLTGVGFTDVLPPGLGIGNSGFSIPGCGA